MYCLLMYYATPEVDALTLLELACASLSMLCVRLLDTGNACMPLALPSCCTAHAHTVAGGKSAGESTVCSANSALQRCRENLLSRWQNGSMAEGFCQAQNNLAEPLNPVHFKK